MKDLCLNDWEGLSGLIWLEHCRQIKKWGIQDHTPEDWLMFTTEELGELSNAIADFKFRHGDSARVRDEAIQVATLAIKIAEMFDNIS
jgi:NTP pyrophosphatase (non-canonical NTP hydrolase)